MVVQGDKQMARTTKQTKTPATPGFAIEIKDDTQLGLAILVAVYAAGGYRPVGVAVSISEAREIAESHWRHYTSAAIEKYELWAQSPRYLLSSIRDRPPRICHQGNAVRAIRISWR